MPPLAVIAGGLASRMWPLTTTIPKSMLQVAGEPFIAKQLRLFHREGIERVVLCLGHLGEQIQDFVGDGDRFGLSVTCSYDGPCRLGTGGALQKALPHLGDEFLVIYGDSYLDIPFAPVVTEFRACGSPALMTVLHNSNRWDTSNVEFVSGHILDYSKDPTPRMAHIDYGLAALSATAFVAAPEKLEFDLSELYRGLLRQGLLAGYQVDQRFYEIGSAQGLAETEAYLLAQIAEERRW